MLSNPPGGSHDTQHLGVHIGCPLDAEMRQTVVNNDMMIADHHSCIMMSDHMHILLPKAIHARALGLYLQEQHVF